MGTKKKFYRLSHGQHGLSMMEYYAHKETPQGYWINANPYYNNSLKWIPKKSKKRFAYPTKEEAVKNYIIRTLSCIQHCERIYKNSKDGIHELLGDAEYCNEDVRKYAEYNKEIWQWDFGK